MHVIQNTVNLPFKIILKHARLRDIQKNASTLAVDDSLGALGIYTFDSIFSAIRKISKYLCKLSKFNLKK